MATKKEEQKYLLDDVIDAVQEAIDESFKIKKVA